MVHYLFSETVQCRLEIMYNVDLDQPEANELIQIRRDKTCLLVFEKARLKPVSSATETI